MINNFSNTEKSLKRYLKEKVTITTATVVSFLIAGTVAMGADAVKVPTTPQNDYIKIKISDSATNKVDVITVDGKGGESTRTTDAEIYYGFTGGEETKDGFIQVDKTGKFVVDKKIVLASEAGNQNGKTTIAIYAKNGQTAVNDGEIWASADNSTAMYAQEYNGKLEYVDNSDAAGNGYATVGDKLTSTTLVNAEKIYTQGQNATAMMGSIGSNLKNEGHIIVDGAGRGMLSIDQAHYEDKDGKKLAKDNYRTITNEANGTIDVIKGVGMKIAAAGEYITATNKGTINVSEADAGTSKGVEIYEPTSYKSILADASKQASKFTNEGTINVESGVGLTASVSEGRKAELVNAKGAKLTVKGGTGAAVTTGVTFTNEGTISVAGAVDEAKLKDQAPAPTYVKATGIEVNGGEFVNAEGATFTVNNKGEGAGINLISGKVVNEGIFNVEAGTGVVIGTAAQKAIALSDVEAPAFTNKGTMTVVAGATGITVNEVSANVVNEKTMTIEKDATGIKLDEKATGSFAFDNKGKAVVKGKLITGVTENATAEINNMSVIEVEAGAKLSDSADNLTLASSGQLKINVTVDENAANQAGENAVTKAEQDALTAGKTLTDAEKEAIRKEAVENSYKEQAYTAVGVNTVTNGGIIVVNDAKGNELTTVVAGNELGEVVGAGQDTNFLNGEKVANELKVEEKNATILAGSEALKGKSINVYGKTLTLQENGTEKTVKMDGTALNVRVSGDKTDSKVAVTTNFDFNGDITVTGEKLESAVSAFDVTKDKTFKFEGTFTGVADTEGKYNDITLAEGSGNSGAKTKFVAAGENTSILANIIGAANTSFDVAEKSDVIYKGTMADVPEVNVASTSGLTLDSSVIFKSNSEVNVNAVADVNGNTGEILVKIDTEGNNALLNSSLAGTKLDFSDSAEESIVLDISNLNRDSVVKVQGTGTNDGEHTLNSNTGDKGTVLGTTSGFYTVKTNEQGKTVVNDKGEVEIEFSVDEYLTSNSKLDGVLKGIAPVANMFASKEDEGDILLRQLDGVYSDTVYAETVKMSMDTLRMNEEAVLSLNARPEAGKWAAAGKALYSNTEYDREGVMRDYNVETEVTGLMGAVEYGVNDTTSVGFAFSGAKQDLDMDHGSADGDAFYFGAYGNKEVGNIRLTAGLGYQMNSIEADNNMLVATGDDYDSEAFSGFVQGKYILKAGEGFTVEPKAKLALTRLTQDSIKDSYFEMEEVEATTFDVELGVDVVKTVALEKGNLNLLAGLSYTRTMGDTDDKYEANFYNVKGAGESFDVMGANLGENTLKLNLGAAVEQANGFFYNGGVSYRFDNEDRESFGVNVGAGYKF